MLDIQQSILTYLEQNHKISLPGIGYLKYTYQPAELLRFTRRILPPKYKLEFIEGKDESTDDFIRFLSDTTHITYAEAQEKFTHFVSHLKEQLLDQQSYHIDHLGTFRYADKKIRFEEDRDSFLLAFNIGYKDVQLPPLESQSIPEEPKKPLSSTTTSSLLPKKQTAIPLFVKVGLVVAGIILVIFFVLAQINTSDYIDWSKTKNSIENWIAELPWLKNKEPHNIDELRDMNRNALAVPVQKPADSMAVKSYNTPVVQQQIATKQLVYHIIAGSFKNRTNAQQCMTNLQELGYKPTLLNFNDTLFRVSLASYPDRQKAVDEYIRITRQHPNLKIWFYSRYE